MPRIWPWALLAGAVAFAVSWIGQTLLGPSVTYTIASAAFGVLVGCLVIQGRVLIWKRRHPWRPCVGCLLTSAYTKQRETARWQ